MSHVRFHGSRLLEAREASKLTQKALAESVGLTGSAISSFEKNVKAPSASVASQLAHVLGVLPSYFVSSHAGDVGSPFFRALHASTKSARKQTIHQIARTTRLLMLVRDFVTLPTVKLPNCSAVEDPELLDDSDIEDLAADTRLALGIDPAGPTGNLTDAAEKAGFFVIRRQLDDPRQDGASAHPPHLQKPLILLNSHKASAVRSRFDLAHEIGHVVLHRNVSTDLRNRTDVYTLMEKQAHAFAANLLMPAASFASTRYRPTAYGLHSHRDEWGVSAAAMLRRYRDLGLISNGDYTEQAIAMSQLGWRRREPGDADSVPEQPRLLAEQLEGAIAGGRIKWDTLSLQMGLPATELRRLLGWNDPLRITLETKKSNVAMKAEVLQQIFSRPAKIHRKDRAGDQKSSFRISDYR